MSDVNGLLHSSHWCETVCFGSHASSTSVQESVVVYTEVWLRVS